MASILSLNRRVLHEKSTNAYVRLQDHGHGIKGDSQLQKLSKRTPASESPRTGTKRRFQDLESKSQEVSHTMTHETQDADAKARPEWTLRSAMDETEEASVSFNSSMLESNITTTSYGSSDASTNTVLTSFHASQEPSQPLEEQFEIVQEESQRTLEQIHATPMPDSTLLLLPPERPILSTELSQDSIRMSSFIEFDEPDEDQKEKLDQDMEMITPPQEESTTERDAKAKQLLEKAAMLRTRLQLAMHKVETNQTSKPFSRLDGQKSTLPEVSLPTKLCSASILPDNRLPSVTGVRNSPESQIAANRARAFRGAYQTKPVRRLETVPMPKIVPTAYSARYTTQPPSRHLNPHKTVPQLPSIPAQSPGNSSGIDTMRITMTKATPSPRKVAGTKPRPPKTPMHQLSNPPGSENGDGGMASNKMHSRNTALLTSSVVKGEAANNLLELMRAR